MKKLILLKWLSLTVLITPAFAQTNPWKDDLEKLHQLVMESSGYLFQNYSQKKWNEDYSVLFKSSSKKTKDEMRVELMKLIAKLEDGHSGIWIREMVIPSENTKWFPIRMYYFEEGLYVIASDEKYADCIGGKVEGIGNFSEAEVSKKLFEISNGENKYGDLFKAPFLMIFPPILSGLGVIEDINILPITIKLSNGIKKQIQVKAETYSEGVGGFFDQFESPSSNSVRMDRHLGVKWPSRKWEVNPPYSLKYFEESSTLFLKMDVLRDPPNYSLMDTYKEFWETVDNKEVEKVIIDLRNNGGGNFFFGAWPFVFKIKQYPQLNQEKKLIVLTGRKTFSAATAFMSLLETHTNATFVGEPSGGRPNQTEGTNEFPPPTLDKIGVDVLLSRGRWTHTRNPLDNRAYITPDITIPESITDWINGVDRVFDEAIKLK